jgi:trimeric autotransporter adhesin
MKNRSGNIFIALALLALLALNLQLSTAHAQGTAFTYQGQLQNNGTPASGTYNLQFSLYTNSTGGIAVAGPVTNSAVAVTNGLFTVAIDFGPGVWNGETNWLQISVETNNATSFTTLSPRQQVTPTPYAITAGSVEGAVIASQLVSIGNLTGSDNFFVGPSGNDTTTGDYNTANGIQALYVNTSGSCNTANGYAALDVNMSGSYNTANGYSALAFNTSGSQNTADGVGALYNNMSGSNNTANGFGALQNNNSGSENIALGYEAGYDILTGSSNIDIGNIGLTTDTNIIRIGSGQTQTFIAGVINGNGGALTNLIAAQLTSIGNNNGGSGNFFVGPSGNNTTTGNDNTANGYLALGNNTSGFANTADGTEALAYNTSGSDNTADGLGALLSNTNGFYNTADGAGALFFNTNGSGNTANGEVALFNNISGSMNTADGWQALKNNINGTNNIALGFQAGINITGSSNIDIGNQGLSTDTNIIRIGNTQAQTFIAGVINGNGGGLTNLNAMQLVSEGNTVGEANFFLGSAGNPSQQGIGNTAVGFAALTNSVVGIGNTAFGADALGDMAGGSGNTALGFDADDLFMGGSDNTAIGANALAGQLLAAGGTNNIALGFNAGSGFAGTESSNIDIGNLGQSGDQNTIRIGTSGIQTTTYIAGKITGNGNGLTNLNGAALAVTGDGNVFLSQAGSASTSGQFNTAAGFNALASVTTGGGNAAWGATALHLDTIGSDNTAVGQSALNSNTNSDNTAIGWQALISSQGSGNIAIGFNAGTGLSTFAGGNIEIGNVGSSTDTNVIRIGQSQTATFIAGNLFVSGAVFSNGVDVVSDRNAKENFAAINPQTVLEKVASLPLTEWNYKTDKAVEHIGPMAQDFYSAFRLNGNDDRHISIADEGGVALAAIQGLNQRLEADNTELKQENTLLAKRLDELEAEVKALAQSSH